MTVAPSLSTWRNNGPPSLLPAPLIPRAEALHGGRAEVADVPARFLIGFRAGHGHGTAAVDVALHIAHVQPFGFADPEQRIRHNRDDRRVPAPGEIGAAVRGDAGG